MKICYRLSMFLLLILFSQSFADVKNFLGEVYTESGLSFQYKGCIEAGDKLAVKKNICYDEKGNAIIDERTEYNESTCEIVNLMIQDFNTGKIEMIVDKGDSYLVKYKKNHSSNFKETEIEKNGLIIHPTVLAMYMQQNMDAILHGEGVGVTLLLPSRLTTIDFIITHKGYKQIEGLSCHEVVLEPRSVLIRQFVNPIYFYVKKDNPSVLVKYEGVLAPTDLQGNSQKGQILFSFN
ncbi:MAG: hypothetical protein JXQ65_11680 [Candidatus Marinimicrobia bacterium]|nr:hypothetical protein [Candidatus Neomarinimicrobiota bacterium]